MKPNLWKVVLRADGGTYRHLIVTGDCVHAAMEAACAIELAPMRSVVSVSEYEDEKYKWYEEWCPDCGADEGQECSYNCSSNWN